jgi:hypothetical protein
LIKNDRGLLIKAAFVIVSLIAACGALAQPPDNIPGGGGRAGAGAISDRIRSFTGGGGKGVDSFKRRDNSEDSITIHYRLADDVRRVFLDSAINEYRRYPVPANYLFLGNTGAPARPFLFTPNMNAGWDAGYHALDVYRWRPAQARFYKTTRPYAELGYVLGSKSEQIIHLLHTQNIKPDWNVAFDYRLISAPGIFKNQKTTHNNYSLTSWYQSKRRRYALYFSATGNNLKASDNGGVKILSQLDDPNKDDRFLVATNLADSSVFSRNFFSNKIESGRYERDFTVWLRQSYDIGKKDSVQVNDSTVIYTFYPKLRMQHTFSSTSYLFNYVGFGRDYVYYKNTYGIDVPSAATKYERFERWSDVSNDFSLYQYPDTKNQQQFIKAGATLQLLKGTLIGSTRSLYNVIAHGEYRNRTRNRQWDIEANGKFFAAGYNAGDYEAKAFLQRVLNSKLGALQVAFENVTRKPSFNFYRGSSFNLDVVSGLKKENLTRISASVINSKKEQLIGADLFLIGNYTNYTNYFQYSQNKLFNVARLSFQRKIKLRKKFTLHTEVYAQQIIGSPNLSLPLFYTRNRLAYEGSLGKKNLRLATGIELKYASPYKLDGWSPMLAQFFYQDSISSAGNLPDLAAYLHFNIRSFNGFIRAENLNTLRLRTGNGAGLKFVNNNFTAMLYPNAGMIFRLGIYWRFVN